MARSVLIAIKGITGMALFAMLVTACTFQGKSVEMNTPLALANPAAPGGRLPRLVQMPDQASTLMSWVEPKEKGHSLKFAVLQGGKWLKQGTASQGENWFVNWADYPSVVAISNTFWVAHWLSRQAGGKSYEYDVSLAISNDAGKTWREIGHSHRDGIAAEHGFVTIFRESEQVAGIVWLDGRDYVKKAERVSHPGKSGKFALRYTKVYANGDMDDEQVVDDNTCTCCWTSVAQTRTGAIAAWRGRTDSEIRDNRYASLANGKWSAPVALGGEGWHIDACPVNGPSIATRGNQVVASWFTAQGDSPRVRLAFSGDSGKVFGNPIEVDDIAPIGRIGLAWLDSRYAVVSWLGKADDNSKKADLYVRIVDKNGAAYVAQKIASLSGGRDTGVPQMSYNGRELIFSWTNPAPEYGITTILLPKSALKKELQLTRSNVKYLTSNLAPFKASICTQNHKL